MNKQEFLYCFQLDKMTVFDIDYYTLSTNKTAHFSTSASHFIKSKRDFDRCGQAQDDLTKKHPTARKFWQKWDNKHLHDLTDNEYIELLQDIEELKNKYNYIYLDLSQRQRPYSPRIPFWQVVEISKQKPKWQV